jgi:hypothetical protein
MAGLGKKTFVNGNILPASELNGYLMEQSVMRFADYTARDAAIPSPTEGMVAYLDNLNWLVQYNGSTWVFVAGERPYFIGTYGTEATTNGAYSLRNITTVTNRGTFSNSSGSVSVPVTGLYSISSSSNFAGNATGVRILGLSVAGSFINEQMFPIGSNATDNRLSVSGIAYITAGQAVDLRVYQTSGTALNTVSTKLQIAYLGA